MQIHTITAECEVVSFQACPCDCWACGADATGLNLGIPIYENLILPNDYEGEWIGVSACRTCFERQMRLTRPMSLARFLIYPPPAKRKRT